MVVMFKELKNFKKSEFGENADKLNGLLLLLIQAIRECIGLPIIVHCAYATSGHSWNSQHYTGNAIDFHFQSVDPYTTQISRLEEVLKYLQVFNRVGLGIYPLWNNPGFHFDIRGKYARWGRIKTIFLDGKKSEAYCTFSETIKYIKKHKIGE